jgi:hypothetical protein
MESPGAMPKGHTRSNLSAPAGDGWTMNMPTGESIAILPEHSDGNLKV